MGKAIQVRLDPVRRRQQQLRALTCAAIGFFASAVALVLLAALFVVVSSTPSREPAWFISLGYTTWWAAPAGMWVWLSLGWALANLLGVTSGDRPIAVYLGEVLQDPNQPGKTLTSGSYAVALRQAGSGVPDITSVRNPGTLKYGFGLNMEQEITPDLGVFSRLAWSDGIGSVGAQLFDTT